MNNIFKDAYFGKAYKTRDGRKAIFLQTTDKTKDNAANYLNVPCKYSIQTFRYKDSGLLLGMGMLTDEDIVSEWKDEVKEEELDKLALDEKQPLGTDHFSFREGFKAGYRKALGRV